MLHYHRRWRVSLPSSRWSRVVPRRYGYQANWSKHPAAVHARHGPRRRRFLIGKSSQSADRVRFVPSIGTGLMGLGYMTKPFGQLVLVSFTHCCASTPSLSTWSSSRALIISKMERSHLGRSFPLRCFQRLSRPHIATGQCHWRDNPNTRGASTPVLSY